MPGRRRVPGRPARSAAAPGRQLVDVHVVRRAPGEDFKGAALGVFVRGADPEQQTAVVQKRYGDNTIAS